MKITKVTIELREAVLATDYVEESAASTKVDFNKLGLEEQIALILKLFNYYKFGFYTHQLIYQLIHLQILKISASRSWVPK